MQPALHRRHRQPKGVCDLLVRETIDVLQHEDDAVVLGQIRHCLYTGALENERKTSDQQYKGQVIDRKSLRASPPQLLVTNATMLEYMLIRKDDEPILQKSAGKLRWIILDEAHTHIGSQAAEMALLLRRVMLAFQVKPQDVRFVATSATFGSDTQTIESLRDEVRDQGIRVTLIRAAGMMGDGMEWNLDPALAKRFMEERHRLGIDRGQNPVSQFDSVAELLPWVIGLPPDVEVTELILEARHA